VQECKCGERQGLGPQLNEYDVRLPNSKRGDLRARMQEALKYIDEFGMGGPG